MTKNAGRPAPGSAGRDGRRPNGTGWRRPAIPDSRSASPPRAAPGRERPPNRGATTNMFFTSAKKCWTWLPGPSWNRSSPRCASSATSLFAARGGPDGPAPELVAVSPVHSLAQAVPVRPGLCGPGGGGGGLDARILKQEGHSHHGRAADCPVLDITAILWAQWNTQVLLALFSVIVLCGLGFIRRLRQGHAPEQRRPARLHQALGARRPGPLRGGVLMAAARHHHADQRGDGPVLQIPRGQRAGPARPSALC